MDLDPEGLASLAAEVAAAAARPGGGTPVETHPLDLTDADGLDAAERAADGADVLVNAAGTQLVRPIESSRPTRSAGC